MAAQPRICSSKACRSLMLSLLNACRLRAPCGVLTGNRPAAAAAACCWSDSRGASRVRCALASFIDVVDVVLDIVCWELVKPSGVRALVHTDKQSRYGLSLQWSAICLASRLLAWHVTDFIAMYVLKTAVALNCIKLWSAAV